MVTKKQIVEHMDDLCTEMNYLNARITALERKFLEEDLKKLDNTVRRKPGRPRKNEAKKNAKN